MQVKYSIIVPAYNVANYIERALRSVLIQKVTNYECIIVNDGSTDNTLEIAKSLIGNDKRFRIVTQENKGLSGARNTGIKNAIGEYLVFLDADDYLTEDALSIMEQEIRTQADITLFNFCVFDDESNKTREISFQGKYTLDDKYRILEECMYTNVFWFAVWEVVVKRSFLEKNNLWFCDGIIHEDELWTMKCLSLSEKVGCVKKPIYCYQIGRPGALTEATSIKELQGLFKVVKELQKFESELKAHNPKMAEIVAIRSSQLFYKIIQRMYMYQTAEEYRAFERDIHNNLYILRKVKKYNIIYFLCKLFGVKLVSNILKLYYKHKG